MYYAKTAISIQGSLLQEANSLARKMKLSRSKLFALAVEEFVQKHRNRHLLSQINKAYSDELDNDEKKTLSDMRVIQRKLLEEQW